MIRRPLTSVVLVALLAGVAACEGRTASPVMVRDSAGVRITLTRDEAIIFAEVDSVPALSIGGADASGPTQFYRVQNVHVDAQDRLWVADGQSGELRIFLPDGTHWKTLGGRGEGPGEFLQIRLLGAEEADTVLVGDSRTGRITVFDPEGVFIRSEPMLLSDSPTPRLFDVFGDGSVLGQVPRVLSAVSLEPGQILVDSVELVRVDTESFALAPYATAAGPLWIWTGQSQVPIPFTINASFAVAGETVRLVSGSSFRIKVFERGRLLEVYGVQRPERPVIDRDLRAYRDFIEEYVQEARRSEHLTALDHPDRPDLLPAYDRVLSAPHGHTWAHVYNSDLSAPQAWDVYDAGRRFVGQVRSSLNFYVMTITEAALTGVWRDDFGVEYVRTYRLIPDRGSTS